MNRFPRAAKTVSLLLSLAVINPGWLCAAVAEKPAAAAALSVPAGIPVFQLPLEAAGMPAAPSALSGLSVEAPVNGPALPALITGPQAVAAHPVIEIIDTLQAKGVSLTKVPNTRAEAARLIAAAEALPDGAARQNILAMAQAVATPAGSPGQAAEFGRAFDNSGKAAGSVPSDPASAGGVWRFLSRLPLLPNGLRKSLIQRADKNRPKAQPLDPRTLEVPTASLRWVPEAESLPASTRDIAAGDKQIVGQDKALRAIHFGVTMPGDRYNLYVSGPEGSGRETAVKHILEQVAPKMGTPLDLVVVTNFKDPQKPIVLQLPSGVAPGIAQGMKGFVGAVRTILPQALAAAKAKADGLRDGIERAIQGWIKTQEAEVAKIRLAGGKFGAQLSLEKSEGSLGLKFSPTFQENGEWKAVASEDELAAKIAAGLFTLEEYRQAMKEMQEASKPFGESFEAMYAAGPAKMEKALRALAPSTVAAGLISQFGRMLLEGLDEGAHNANTPEHKAWEKRAAQRQAAFVAEVAKTRVGRFGFIFRETSSGAGLVIGQEVDGQMVFMPPQEFLKLKSSGQITAEDFKAIQGHYSRLNRALKELQAEIAAEHQALHEAELASRSPAEVAASERARQYFEGLMEVAASGYQLFLPQPKTKGDPEEALSAPPDPAELFRVNVVVSNAPGSGAPILYAKTHSVEELFGSAESNDKLTLLPGVGAIKTQGIGLPKMKAGLYQKAAGGFLVLNVMELLRQPGSYQALMRAVRTGEAEIVEGGLMGTLTGRGDRYAIPAKVKVVLVGPPMIRMLLSHYDQDFGLNFGTMAEFESHLKIDAESISGYLQFFANVIAKGAGEVMHMSRDAIGSLLEFSARLVDSNQKLSAQFGELYGLMREASFFARQTDAQEVRREHVETAISAREDREGVYRGHYLELLKDRVFLVETEGAVVGQINGLAVMGSFGVPMRVTVRMMPGGNRLSSVDREAAATGQSFNKALGVVGGFLGELFAKSKGFLQTHLSVSFEQNYGGIDGDSATSTEIYGILSALSGVPIRQDMAVTGSADQFGNVQAIGGVNEKIEGFFELCKLRGLTGKQGIVIPKTNVANLMLKPEIVQAVREGKFHIYAVGHVREGLEILTGTAFTEIVRRAEERIEELRVASRGN